MRPGALFLLFIVLNNTIKDYTFDTMFKYIFYCTSCIHPKSIIC